MTTHIVRLQDVHSQAWRNGGGVTRELLAWPIDLDPWSLRISVADVETDGPFSPFPGVERWFVVTRGAGVVLGFPQGDKRVALNDAPFRFDGGAAPSCRLLKGATRDLNLMLRDGHGLMRPVDRGVGWEAGFAVRGLYTATAGRWTDGTETHELAADTLLWRDDGKASVWSFDSETSPARAWWIAYSPGARW